MSTGAWALWGQRLSHSPVGLNHPAQCHTCRCSVQVWAKKDHPWGMNVEGGTERYIENQRISESKRIAFPFPNQWEDRIPSSAHSHIPRPNHSQAACPRAKKHGNYSNPFSAWYPLEYLRRAFTSTLYLPKIMSGVHSKGENWAQDFLISCTRFTNEGNISF